MLERLTRPDGRAAGFSLVELLIVVIVMGVLAAIAIPLFIQQRAKAHDAAAQSDLRYIAGEVSAFWTEFGEGRVDLTLQTAPAQYTIEGFDASDVSVWVVHSRATKDIDHAAAVVSGGAGTMTETN
ncbi:MAG: prepilin-type N-terminal cleavage/methylation domain-containing protein, partial [Bifidobacteriaceae bacterium]|nr:prepilin-type N-terminal cleavage/methylation domain-containing protein [Bifidobacteriaceae bacterium]